MLYYRTKFAYFILKVSRKEKRKVMVNILRDISTIASRYMLGVITVVTILCVLNSLGLYIIGMDFPVLLGIISAIMNFIPYFGTLIGGAIPLVFSILISTEPFMPMS
ncbi:MAG: AI-2E family transporter [Bacteroidales bacterium]|nr:AI-2E family transporter [Bacteroidales bacterium]